MNKTLLAISAIIFLFANIGFGQPRGKIIFPNGQTKDFVEIPETTSAENTIILYHGDNFNEIFSFNEYRLEINNVIITIIPESIPIGPYQMFEVYVRNNNDDTIQMLMTKPKGDIKKNYFKSNYFFILGNLDNTRNPVPIKIEPGGERQSQFPAKPEDTISIWVNAGLKSNHWTFKANRLSSKRPIIFLQN